MPARSIFLALESAHALSAPPDLSEQLIEGSILVVNVSALGDKDISIVAEALGKVLKEQSSLERRRGRRVNIAPADRDACTQEVE